MIAAPLPMPAGRSLSWVLRPAVRLLAHTRLTPNALTLARLPVAILAALLFSRGYYVYCLAAALLFFVSALFDEMDGMLARLKFRESASGTWIQGLIDKITYLAIFAGIVAGLHREYGSWPLKCGIALIIGYILSVLLIGRQRKVGTSRLRAPNFVHYLLLFAIVGAMPIFLWVAAIASNLTWMRALYFAPSFYHRPRPQAPRQEIEAAA